MQNTCTASPAKEPISVPKSLRGSINRHTNNAGSILPAKRKIRVLKLLNDSSSEDDNENKPLSSRIANFSCSKALPISKSLSPKITGAPAPLSVEAVLQPNVLEGKDLGAWPFSVNNISSPPLPKMMDDSSEPFLVVAPNLNAPSPLTNMAHKIHPPPVPVADACKSPVNYRKLFKEPHSNKVLTRAQTSNLACDGRVSQKEVPVSALFKPQPALTSTCKPFAMKRPPALPAAETRPQPSNDSCKPLSIKSHSLETPALDQRLQLPQDTSKDMPSSNGASPASKRPSSRAKPLKRPHRSHAQESCESVDASLSTCDKAETLAPITVQNVSHIYLRRSRLEELLSDQRFTLLIMGAFVRIRHSKHENKYRLVQIAGTSTLQAHYYQVGEKKTNVVLEVLNLNKQQRIRIDHVSNNMFTEEECQRLQQSVELGFINAPTVRALEEKAAALQRGKVKKYLDETLAKFASKGASKEHGLNKEFRVSWDKDGKTSLSPDHSVKPQTQIDREKQVQADQVPLCVESTTRNAERGSESFEAHTETENNGEKRQNKCPNCGIDENPKRKIQNHAKDGGPVCVNEALTTAGKQADADQQSDISVEMSTAFAETGQNKLQSPEIVIALANHNFTEDEAELTPPKKAQKKGTEDEAELTPPTKAQKKGLQDLGSNRYLMKEHWPSLMAQTVNHAQGAVPAEARIEAQIYERKHMNAIHHCDVGVDLATNIHGIAEDRTHVGTLSFSSATHPGTKDVVATSNLSQWIPLTECREYGVINHPTDNDTCTTFQVENQGCTDEYITTVVGLNDSGKRPGDVMHWFYQDMKERTFGPFSLKQLRKWNRTGVFPPDLKIWRTIAGQNSSILLVDALNAQEMEVILGTGNSIAVESCLNPENETRISFTESGSACHTISKGMSNDGGVPTTRTDWLSPSAHAERRLDSSLNLGDWTAPTEQMELKSVALWASPLVTQFILEDMSIETSQDEHVTMNKEFENALNVPTEMITDDCWRLHTSATETSVEKEIKCRSDTKATEGKCNPTHIQAKETSAEGERGVQSSAAHMLEKEISAVKETEGKCSPCSPPCMEGKSSPALTEQDTLASSDDGWSLSEIRKPKLGTLWSIPQSSQFEILKEKAASIQTSRCETLCNFEVHVSNNRPKKDIQQSRGTIADTGLTCQSLAEETHERKRESYSVTQRQEMLTPVKGWNSPETCDFELEKWETQYDDLKKKEASINRYRDEILSNLIDAVTAEECKKSTPVQSNCHTLIEDISVNGNNISRNTENLKKLATLDDGRGSPVKLEQGTGWGSPNASLNDGWGSPGKLEQETGWGSPNATLDDGWGSPRKLEHMTGWGSPSPSCFIQSDQRISMVQSCHDKRLSKKLQSKQVERKNTPERGMYDGIQKDINHNLCGRARSLSCEMHLEKDQRWTESSQGHGRAWRVEDIDRKGSSRGRDTSLSKKSGGQRDFCYSKSTGGRASKFEDHTDFGKGTDSRHKRSHSRESIMWSKEEKFWSDERYFSDKRNTAPSTQREVETALKRSHSREPYEQDTFKKDQKSFPKQLKVSAKNGDENEDEVRTSHSSDGWKFMSKERRASPENNGNRMEREVRKSHARNDRGSFSRKQRASPESAGQSIEKDSKTSHSLKDWRSVSKDQKASPENAGNRERKRSYSRIDRRCISREQMVYHDTTGKRDLRRSHSGNDWEHALREHKASPESGGKRSSRSRSNRRSFPKELEASPENAGKITEKEVKNSQTRSNRRSLSKETMASSRNAGRRNKEEDWEAHWRDNLRSVPRDYQSLSRSVDGPLKSRPFSRESSAWANSSAHRSFSRKLDDDIHKGAPTEGRLERDNYTHEKFQGRQRGPSPCKELIQQSAHKFCPKESTPQPIQTSDQGWTPLDSPLDHAAGCWSPDVVGVEKLDEPVLLSDISSKPEAHSGRKVHPSFSEHTGSDSYPELPPPPPLPVSAAPSQMKPPPPPPLPAETSHICHIDKYNV